MLVLAKRTHHELHSCMKNQQMHLHLYAFFVIHTCMFQLPSANYVGMDNKEYIIASAFVGFSYMNEVCLKAQYGTHKLIMTFGPLCILDLEQIGKIVSLINK